MATINLFGASGHAKVIADLIVTQGDEIGKIFDDNPHTSNLKGVEVYRPTEYAVTGPLVISIGSNRIRKAVAARFPVPYTTVVHPSAVLSEDVEIGVGSVIMAGAILQADVKIGKHCIVNTGASIDHECVLSDFVHISPHATLCGNVGVGEGSWIGAGATVVPGIKIGKWCDIGAGAVVIRDVPDGAVVAGVPGKVIKYKEGYGAER